MSGQMCLLQTCCSFYNSLILPEDRDWLLAEPEYSKYIALIARDHPDTWVTVEPPHIRSAEWRDLPKLPKTPPYFRAPGWDRNALDGFLTGGLMVEHKHVQMSIKYSQLENKTRRQKEYLKVLMKPYETKFNPLLSFHPSKRGASLGYFKSHPKVVSGRYLLYTKRAFVSNCGPISTLLDLQGTFGPCLHQYRNMERFIAYQRKKAFGDETMALHEEETPHQNYHCMTAGWQPECSESFFLSIRQAICRDEYLGRRVLLLVSYRVLDTYNRFLHNLACMEGFGRL